MSAASATKVREVFISTKAPVTEWPTWKGLSLPTARLRLMSEARTSRNRALSAWLFTGSFNFRAEDPARRIRAVQYISHPTYTWQKLRAEQPGRYEQPVSPVPDPNDWFRARVVVASPRVSVFVNEGNEPSLVVNQLSDRKKGRVGLWVGNNSSGDFASLRIVPA